ncbi:hypothetical protein GCM10010251_80660 [Streptomyces aurantiogriseus]|uniref:Uncharacterized protein n=2 Tax=Streptomyces aurantiogriseus TaxID=66870 RepID=A0A918KZ25_9ACTN|nr:hypothetical protein GCM10010251_80660 [Streptomyces aurantiogriseus]
MEAREHKKAFEHLRDSLKEYTLDYSRAAIEGEIPKALERDSRILDERSVDAYGTESGHTFALDQDGWISMAVPEDSSPGDIATEVERFLQEMAPTTIREEGLTVNIDLVCPPGTILDGIQRLSSVAELSLTVRLPNPGCDLPDAIKRMEEYGAQVAEEKYRNERGLGVPLQEAERFDKEASRGNADVRVVSTDGDVFDSRENPAEFKHHYEMARSTVPPLLVLALAWLSERWFGGGGPT